MKKRFSKRTKFIITLLCAAGLTSSLFFLPTDDSDSLRKKEQITIPSFSQVDKDTALAWLREKDIDINHASIKKAIYNGDFETLHYILAAGWNIDRYTLALAVACESEAMCRYLLERGANANGHDILSNALKTGDLDIIRLLLKHKAKWESYLGPLHIAIIEDHTSVIKKLCNEKENAAHAESYQYSYLAWVESPKIAKILLKAGANPAQKGQTTPLLFAIKRHNKKMIQFLLEHGADPNACSPLMTFPMHYAALYGNAEIIEMLTDAGASVNVSNQIGRTPLHHAAERGNSEIVKALLDAGASVNAEAAYKKRPIHLAAASGNLETINLLLNADAICTLADSSGNLPLHIACLNGQADAAAKMIESGADVNVANDRGQTPLILAAQADSPETIEVLLEAGAKIDAFDKEKRGIVHYALSASQGKILPLIFSKKLISADSHAPGEPNTSLLQYAAQEELPHLAQALLANGANIGVQDSDQDTPLHSAAYRNNTATMAVLLKHGANIHATNRKGNTPLHYAVRREHLQATELLMKHQANPHTANKQGETPISLAVEHGNMEIFHKMVDEKADLPASLIKPLMETLARTGNRELAEFLEKKGHFNANKDTLLKAAERGHLGLCLHIMDKEKLNIDTTNKDKQTLLILAAKHNHYYLAEALLNRGANVHLRDAHGKNALDYNPNYRIRNLLQKHLDSAAEAFFKIVAERSPRQLKEYCKKLPDVNITNHGGYNAVHVAAEKDRPHMINVLHQAGVNINHRNHSSLETPLMKAAWCNSRYALETLCKLGADLNVCNKDKSNALILATGKNHKYIVSQLIERKADLNMQNRWGDSALILAITRRHADICNMLIKADGINPHLTANNKDTALHRAAKNGMNSQVLDLCRIGALAHVPNAQGELAIDLVQDAETKEDVLKQIKRIPLHNFMYAAWNGDMKTLRRIVKHRPKIVPRKDAMGFTALHLAAHNGQLEAVQYLCRDENQIHAKNKDGQSPLDFAKRGNHNEIIEYLETFDPQSVTFDDGEDTTKKKGKRKKK